MVATNSVFFSLGMEGIKPVDIVVHDFHSAEDEGSIRAVIL